MSVRENRGETRMLPRAHLLLVSIDLNVGARGATKCASRFVELQRKYIV